MEIIVSKSQDTPSISIMRLRGALDGDTYQYFIDEAQKLYDLGARDLLLDMSEMTFLSSAGIAALHRVARVFRGEDRSNLDEGWAAMRAIGRERDDGYQIQEHIKLLSPSDNIQQVLDMVGFKAFFEIYTDIHPAIASFH
jgi:anti-anti-sigma regulatory factor